MNQRSFADGRVPITGFWQLDTGIDHRFLLQHAHQLRPFEAEFRGLLATLSGRDLSASKTIQFRVDVCQASDNCGVLMWIHRLRSNKTLSSGAWYSMQRNGG